MSALLACERSPGEGKGMVSSPTSAWRAARETSSPY